VLIVDDHEDSVQMYACALLAMGFDPVTAETADAAFARTCELKPDIVVADISLPGISGLELTRRLREDTRTKDTRIIVLTGHADASFERKACDAGCDRFLAKPCLPDTLALEVRNVLSSQPNGQRWWGSTDGER
jgi:DNA-binding response OmpR family regulator